MRWSPATGFPTMHASLSREATIRAHAGPAQEEQVSMPKVTFIYGKEKKEVEVPEGANLRDEALKAGVPVYAGLDRYLNCRGLGLCGTCRVLVQQGAEHLSSKTRRERFRLALSFASIGHENDM